MGSKKKPANRRPKKIVHRLGDKHFIDNTEMTTKYVNRDWAWIFPTIDDEDAPLIARHIAYAVLDEYGKIRKI